MLPAFLKKYESELSQYRVESARIIAKPNKTSWPLSFKKSKLLGLPYLPITMDYPMNKFGKPLVMIAQINFEEMPRLKNYPTKGILQVFTSTMFWDIGNEYYLYIYHKNINLPYQKHFPFFTAELYEGLPINCEHSLAFYKTVEYGGYNDSRFNFDFSGKDINAFRDELTNDELEDFDQLFQPSGHKIGGYASFTQGDPRADDPAKKNDVLLLQIDSDEEIMFGDAGISNIFISANDLKKRRFDNAYFNWDCA